MKMIQCKFLNKKCKIWYLYNVHCKKNTIYIVNLKRQNIGCIINFLVTIFVDLFELINETGMFSSVQFFLLFCFDRINNHGISYHC